MEKIRITRSMSKSTAPGREFGREIDINSEKIAVSSTREKRKQTRRELENAEKKTKPTVDEATTIVVVSQEPVPEPVVPDKKRIAISEVPIHDHFLNVCFLTLP